MKLKSWSPVIAGLLVSLTAASAFSQSAQTQRGTVPTVVCETQNGTPTTVLGNIPYFHWSASALPSYMDPQQLCEDVSAKLKSAYDQYDGGFFLSTDEIRDLPVVFIETPGGHRQELFSLPSTSNLNQILDSMLENSSTPENATRGDHRRIMNVPFWDLF